jgi:hypothetical protein
MQSLPSLSAMRLPVGTGRAPTTAVTGGRLLSVDATRELAKCANGELVSHDVVRDGIDALLQLKRASFDHGVDVKHQESGGGGRFWGGERGELRTCPEGGSRSCFPPTPWSMSCGVKEESSSDDEEEDEEEQEEDCSTCNNSPAPIQRKIRRTTVPKTRNAPPLKKKPVKPPPKNRPPTIWHPRKSEFPTASFPTPESPKSKISVDEVESQVEEEEEEEETTGPAVLHFSCLQCHRAKKRCNRTRPCSRCISRGMEKECRYPDKHDPRSVLRACLRCWQTKKKCDRKQPSCGKCDKVGVKCVYRRENQMESPEVRSLKSFVIDVSPRFKGFRFRRRL